MTAIHSEPFIEQVLVKDYSRGARTIESINQSGFWFAPAAADRYFAQPGKLGAEPVAAIANAYRLQCGISAPLLLIESIEEYIDLILNRHVLVHRPAIDTSGKCSNNCWHAA